MFSPAMLPVWKSQSPVGKTAHYTRFELYLYVFGGGFPGQLVPGSGV